MKSAQHKVSFRQAAVSHYELPVFRWGVRGWVSRSQGTLSGMVWRGYQVGDEKSSFSAP